MDAIVEENTTEEIAKMMEQLGRDARAASRILATVPTVKKNDVLFAQAQALRDDVNVILEANSEDLKIAKSLERKESFIDRLTLTPDRIEAIASSLEDIAKLPDPIGSTIAEWTQPNGLELERVRTPLGVIGIIFESRPNVTADAGALSFKAGNASILRPGSDSFNSSKAIHACLVKGLISQDLPENAIQLVPVRDRIAVGHMLSGLNGNIDVIVPRGGKSLVARVQEEARVPVFSHLEGICHIYVHEDADLEMAQSISVNAKLRRTGICGAAETILIDQKISDSKVKSILTSLIDAGCEVRGDQHIQNMDSRVFQAKEEDWYTEYLAKIISIRMVSDMDEAVSHIEKYGSQHTESIITQNEEAASDFMHKVDSAIVMHNASTQFADGGEFGMGAEIGIATGRMHARGPVGLEQLTSFKYKVRGKGHVRP